MWVNAIDRHFEKWSRSFTVILLFFFTKRNFSSLNDAKIRFSCEKVEYQVLKCCSMRRISEQIGAYTENNITSSIRKQKTR